MSIFTVAGRKIVKGDEEQELLKEYEITEMRPPSEPGEQ